MRKHTPGPWAFCNDTLCQATGNYLHLGKWIESPGLGYAAAANKALIAAAPDLLLILQKIAEAERKMPENPLSGLCDEARAAIAKARGE